MYSFIKSDREEIYKVRFYISLSKNTNMYYIKNASCFPLKYKQHNCFFNMDYNLKILLNYICELNDHFWRSCDSEDWSNDAENAALATGINDILNRKVHLNFKNILKYCCFCGSIKTASVSRRDFYQKHYRPRTSEEQVYNIIQCQILKFEPGTLIQNQ